MRNLHSVPINITLRAYVQSQRLNYRRGDENGQAAEPRKIVARLRLVVVVSVVVVVVVAVDVFSVFDVVSQIESRLVRENTIETSNVYKTDVIGAKRER